MMEINEFIYSVIQQSMNLSIQWIHLVHNELDEVINTKESMIKWTYLLHEFDYTMKSFCLIFDELIFLQQSMIRWTHLKHEFNYKENQWIHVFSHIIINECISTMKGHEYEYYVSIHLFGNIFVHEKSQIRNPMS